MDEAKYILINEITEEILRTSNSLPELQKIASKLSIKKGKKQTLLIKESATDEIVTQYGLLLD